MCRGIGIHGQVKLAKKAKTCPHCDVTYRKPHTQFKFFFKIETRRLAVSVDGLNTLFVLSPAEL